MSTITITGRMEEIVREQQRLITNQPTRLTEEEYAAREVKYQMLAGEYNRLYLYKMEGRKASLFVENTEGTLLVAPDCWVTWDDEEEAA